MRWTGITGSWRKTNANIEQDVRAAVRDIMERGDGIITGGALNVDFFATDEALKIDPNATHIKVFIPSSLETYAAHYRRRAQEEVITAEQADALIAQLTNLRNANKNALIEGHFDVLNPTTYFERNLWVVDASDDLLAFQVNGSEGVEDTISKAVAQSKPVIKRSYTIT